MTVTKLKGMTWNHPRGYDPMIACSALFMEKTGVDIDWDKRSLQDFESFPVEELARAYDLIVIDHPHVGQITAEHCLEPLDRPARATEFAALSAGSIGLSFPSYHWQGRQWGFPIDAATQVLMRRPDLLAKTPTQWDEVIDLAAHKRVLLALRPPHSLMCLFTLTGNLGAPAKVEGPDLFDPEIGARAYEMIAEIASFQSTDAFGMDPIAVSEIMSAHGNSIAISPMIYGYVSYALEGFRPHRLAFTDLAVAGENGPVGSALGGTGIAVSAFSAQKEAAIDFAYFVASGDVQAGMYAGSGGQPGHACAWEDDRVNAVTGNFYRNTRKTLDHAFLRPRHDGYMGFQDAAAKRLNEGLLGHQPASRVINDINALFARSLPKG